MCIDFSTMTKANWEYAEAIAKDEEEKKSLEDELNLLRNDGMGEWYHAGAYSHPKLPAFYIDYDRPRIAAMEWGLIPSWSKSVDQAEQMRKRGINARGETVFEKPMFRQAAKSGRVLIPMDGFYEYHDTGKEKIPHYIYLPNQVLLCAGIASQWKDLETEESISSFSLVTCTAIPQLAEIHNNPANSDDPRMPLFMEKEAARQWLDLESPKELLQELIKPFQAEFQAHPVEKLRGKRSLGNVPEAREKVGLF